MVVDIALLRNGKSLKKQTFPTYLGQKSKIKSGKFPKPLTQTFLGLSHALSLVQTDATLLANKSQHYCVRLHVLLHVVGGCCTNIETSQTFSYVQTDATTPKIVGSFTVTEAPNENIVQNHLNIALLNVF